MLVFSCLVNYHLYPSHKQYKILYFSVLLTPMFIFVPDFYQRLFPTYNGYMFTLNKKFHCFICSILLFAFRFSPPHLFFPLV